MGTCQPHPAADEALALGLKLTVRFELTGDGPISPQKVEETKVALRKLGLDDNVITQ